MPELDTKLAFRSRSNVISIPAYDSPRRCIACSQILPLPFTLAS